jgi:benzoyl-CoA reductase/2-hydroxyglutaryl-CoA dehydratase subunit BcrC/BadD/HgdB
MDTYFSPLMSVHMRGQRAFPLVEKQRDELKERVEKGIGVIDDEKLRLFWFAVPPVYNFEITHYPEKYGAVVVKCWIERVFNGFDPTVLDPDHPLESMARKLLTRPDNPNFQLLPEAVVNIVKDWRIDGVVAAVKRSCGATPSQMRRLKDAILEATGVPTMIVDADYADSREFDEESIAASLDSFVETLLSRKGA